MAFERAVQRAERARIERRPDAGKRFLLHRSQMALKTGVRIAIFFGEARTKVSQRIVGHVPIPEIADGQHQAGVNHPRLLEFLSQPPRARSRRQRQPQRDDEPDMDREKCVNQCRKQQKERPALLENSQNRQRHKKNPGVKVKLRRVAGAGISAGDRSIKIRVNQRRECRRLQPDVRRGVDRLADEFKRGQNLNRAQAHRDHRNGGELYRRPSGHHPQGERHQAAERRRVISDQRDHPSDRARQRQ